MIYTVADIIIQVLAEKGLKPEKPLKDQYTLKKCSNNLIEQSDCFMFNNLQPASGI